MPYIHELAAWPEFRWDTEALADLLATVRYKQGRHLGKMDAMGFELKEEATLRSLTDEVVKSFAIEGEELDTEEVRSSVARRLGIDAAGLPEPGRYVDGVVEMMLDATQNFDQPLTTERLYGWHSLLFPAGRSGMRRLAVGAWRRGDDGPMQVVSGAMGKERVHFEAPACNRISNEMDRFLEWFNRPANTDLLIKAGLAHIWFITIHPFDDGNGRIARAIGDMLLAQADGSRERFYSISSRIEAERAEYYVQLEAAQRGSLDITSWLAWFLGCLERAIDMAGESLAAVLHKARLWEEIKYEPVNERQRKVINRMLGNWQGHMSTSKYARIAKCSRDTALRDIRRLVDRGILLKNQAGGRSTSYRLADCAETGPWPPEMAWQWYKATGPIFGCNYLPRTAVNATEMWQKESFDPQTIDEELGWAEKAGYNSLRVFLQYLVWQDDAEGLKERMDRFLSIADAHGMGVMFVPFCDCAFAGREPYLGKQDQPVPGVHNSGWVPSPGLHRVTDQSLWPDLENYIKDLVGTFGQDERVLIWDLYNEPGNSQMGEKSLPLVEASFRWAREAGVSQPLTAGAWIDFDGPMSQGLMALSDVVSFHGYEEPHGIVSKIRICQRHGRPILCTEWLHRPNGNTFEAILPLFRREKVGAYHWGLVAGRTQTCMPWGSREGDPVPDLWQHDVFHADGAPYDKAELDLIKSFSS